MALTQSLIVETVLGPYAVKVWDITPDAAETSFATGMESVAFCQATAASAVTDATFGVFTENEYPAGTAAADEIYDRYLKTRSVLDAVDSAGFDEDDVVSVILTLIHALEGEIGKERTWELLFKRIDSAAEMYRRLHQ